MPNTDTMQKNSSNTLAQPDIHVLRNMALLLCSTMTVMSGITISPALPGMRMEFSGQPYVDLLVKLSLTLPSLSIALGAFLVGVLLDRSPRRPVLLSALVLCGVFGSAGFFLDALPSILISRILLGIAVAGIMVTATTLLGDYFSGDALKRYMGLQSTFIGLSSVVFLLAAGALATIGWRYPFLLYLAPLLLIFPIAYLAINEPVRVQTGAQASVGTLSSLGGSTLGIALINVFIFFGMVAYYTIPLHLPFYLKAIGELQPFKAGLAIAMMGASFALTSFLYPRLNSQAKFSKITAITFCILATGYFGLSVAPSYIYMLIAVCICGIGMGLLLPNLSVSLIQIAPAHIRGRLVGLFTTCIFLGQFSSPFITEPLTQSFGFRGCYRGVAIAMLILGALAVGGAMLRRKD